MASLLNPTGLSEESSRRNPAVDLEAGASFFVVNPSAWAGVAPTLRGLILPAIRLTQKSAMPEFMAALRVGSIHPPLRHYPDGPVHAGLLRKGVVSQ